MSCNKVLDKLFDCHCVPVASDGSIFHHMAPTPGSIEETTHDMLDASSDILLNNFEELVWDFASLNDNNTSDDLGKEIVEHLLCWKDKGHG